MADRPKVVVVGDIICDVWMYARPSDHNPENADVVFTRTDDAHYVLPGGAAHVALCLQQLGCDVVLFGCVNWDDAKLSTVLKELREAGVDCDHVSRLDCATPVKTRLLSEDGRKILARVDGYEDATEVAVRSPFDRHAFRAELPHVAAVVVADYDKGYLSSWRRELAGWMRGGCNVPLFVDCRVEHMDDYRGANLIKVNAAADNAFRVKHGRSIINEHISTGLGVDCVVVTRGTKSVEWSFEDLGRSITAVPEVVGEQDGTSPAVGAGDAFMAGLVAHVTTQAPDLPRLEVIDIHYAIECAVHIAAARLRTLKASLDSSLWPLPPLPPRSLSTTDAISLVEKARADGKRIVFTNGCFDLFHSGHLYSLEAAKAHGDFLIVGVDSDRHVSKLKGPERPVRNHQCRSTLVGSLRCVDAVTPVFDNEHLERLIEHIKPDVLVKGGDYKVEDVIGAQFAERVVILPRLEGHSTTDTINHILEVQGPKNV